MACRSLWDNCLRRTPEVIVDLDFGFPDRVDVRTFSDGQWHENLKAQVQEDKILVLTSTLPISEGDELRRKLPNGTTEEYDIGHVQFQVATLDFPGMITVYVRKQGSELHARLRTVQNVYKLTGANPMVNVNSVDSSVNVLTVNSETLFSDLAKVIREQVEGTELRDQLSATVQQMEQTRGTPEFTSSFQSFIALAANCMTIVLPFIPALTQLLKQ
jgi:hypothetical protein